MALALLLCLQDPAALDRLLDGLRSDDIAVREESGGGILRIGRPCLPRLQKELETTEDSEVRSRLADLIGRLLTVHELWIRGDGDGALRKLALEEGSANPDATIASRKERLRCSLTRGGDRFETGRPVIILTLDEACRVLKVDRHWILAVMLEILGGPVPPASRSQAWRFLASEGADSGSVVLPLLRSDDRDERISACVILGNLRDERAVPELERICRSIDEDVKVLVYAKEAYQKIKRRDPPSP